MVNLKKSCKTCKKSVYVGGKMKRCEAFTDYIYFWKKYNDCFAWTDDNNWEEKLNEQVRIYGKQLAC